MLERIIISIAMSLLYFTSVHGNIDEALLKTSIHATPMQNTNSQPGKIQPGTHMQLSVVITNVGDMSNAPGSIFIRFVFPKPLNTKRESEIFKTETLKLPSIEPGKEVTIIFSTLHKWPSIFDFIRHDWAMREYEAVALIGADELVTGTRVISFSAYYYEGPKDEKPAKVLSYR